MVGARLVDQWSWFLITIGLVTLTVSFAFLRIASLLLRGGIDSVSKLNYLISYVPSLVVLALSLLLLVIQVTWFLSLVTFIVLVILGTLAFLSLQSFVHLIHHASDPLKKKISLFVQGVRLFGATSLFYMAPYFPLVTATGSAFLIFLTAIGFAISSYLIVKAVI